MNINEKITPNTQIEMPCGPGCGCDVVATVTTRSLPSGTVTHEDDEVPAMRLHAFYGGSLTAIFHEAAIWLGSREDRMESLLVDVDLDVRGEAAMAILYRMNEETE